MGEKIRLTILKKLSAGSFAGHVATLMTGTALAQLLQLLITPLLTRLYSPADFGVFSIYISLVEIIAIAACLRYECAIVIAEDDETAANLLFLCILICSGIIAATFLLAVFCREAVAGCFEFDRLANYLWFLPLSVMAAGMFLPLNYWSIRRSQFRRLAARQVTGTGATVLTQLGAGIFLTPAPGGLIGGSIFGQTAATARLAWQIFREEGREILTSAAWEKLKKAAVRYRRFPVYESGAAVLNSLSYMVPVFLLAWYFTPAVVGFYALGVRVLSMPGTFIGRAVGQVFFQRAAEAFRCGNLEEITLKVFRWLLHISFVPLALIAITAPDLFSMVFGPEWHTAGEYVQWLCPAIILNFVASPLSSIYDVLERQSQSLLFNVMLFTARTSGLVIGGLYYDPLLAVKLFGLGSAVMYLYFLLYILHMAGSPVLTAGRIIAGEVFLSLPYIMFPAAVLLLSHNAVLFVLSAVLAGLVFCGMLLKKFSTDQAGADHSRTIDTESENKKAGTHL